VGDGALGTRAFVVLLSAADTAAATIGVSSRANTLTPVKF
jgi:hypothetical protein